MQPLAVGIILGTHHALITAADTSDNQRMVEWLARYGCGHIAPKGSVDWGSCILLERAGLLSFVEVASTLGWPLEFDVWQGRLTDDDLHEMEAVIGKHIMVNLKTGELIDPEAV